MQIRLDTLRVSVCVAQGSLTNATRGQTRELRQCRSAADRSFTYMMQWLDAHSLWDWHSHVSCVWIGWHLDAETALSLHPPMLPAEAAGYGRLDGPFVLDRREPETDQER